MRAPLWTASILSGEEGGDFNLVFFDPAPYQIR
jgi:hypothetical protein